MCRFLLYKSKQPTTSQPLITAFARMAEKSRAFDGDWQGDGWGISWLNKDKEWQSYRSTKPIWKDTRSFSEIPSTSIFAVHARSASFPQHKNNIKFNQPFVNHQYIYAFNGLLEGVTLSLPGEIGSQKIWYLLQSKLAKGNVEIALNKIKKILINNARDVQALNIGLADKKNIYALCYFSNYPRYYKLHYVNNPDYKIICSETLPGFNFQPLDCDNIIKL